MTWEVGFAPAAKKSKNKVGKGALPAKVKEALALLVLEIEKAGPIRKNWPNFSALASRKKNKPIPDNATIAICKKVTQPM